MTNEPANYTFWTDPRTDRYDLKSLEQCAGLKTVYTVFWEDNPSIHKALYITEIAGIR